MTSQRRYSGSEIERIFQRATDPESSDAGVAGGDGLTLPELQEIGRQVGIAPERVAEAAVALDRGGRVDRLGPLPMGVSHTVPLPRAPSDDQWQWLLADLRETFGAFGRETVNGDVRQWRNGNLFARVEPTPAGYRLRLGTRKGQAGPLLISGSISLLVALLFLVMVLLGVTKPEGMVVAIMLAAAGIGQLGVATLPLSAWASTRREQMQGVGERFTAILSPADPDQPRT